VGRVGDHRGGGILGRISMGERVRGYRRRPANH
jgi:hypothetical protein